MATNFKHLGQLGLEQLLQLMAAEFDKKVVKEDGKGLSTNDFTNALLEKLNGIEEGANKYEHAAHTAQANGFYKVTVDAEGHVSGVEAVAKEDITALGIPGQDTTYVVATQSADGLMAATDKAKLDGIAEGANKYEHATFTPAAEGFYKITVNAEGHVSGVVAVSKDDIVALGIPAQDTTYAEATQDAAGLMSAADKKKVDGLGALASKSEVAEADLEATLAKKINDAAGAQHTHDNKDLLDTYTQTEANLADAVAKKHEHANAAELAKIADGDKAKWDAAEQKAHTHANAEELDKIVAGDKAKWDAGVVTAGEAKTQSETNKTAIGVLNGDENTEGSVAKTVKDYVAGKIASAYKASGTITYESLPEPSAAVEGNVYNISNDFTTDSDFVEGAGKQYKAGVNVVIVNIEGTYKYDVMAMSFDGFVQEANISEYSADEVTTMWNSVFTA